MEKLSKWKKMIVMKGLKSEFWYDKVMQCWVNSEQGLEQGFWKTFMWSLQERNKS